MPTSKAYQNAYLELPEQLVRNYPELNFENHCYLRIALDQVYQTKWDTKIPKLAYKYLTKLQLETVQKLLGSYQKNRELLLKHNKQSLSFRRKSNGPQMEIVF